MVLLLLALIAGADPGETLMEHVSAIAQASVVVRQERQLTYTKKLEDGNVKEWEGWWDREGDHQKLVRVNGKAKRGIPEPSRDLNLIGLMRSRFRFRMLEPVTENTSAKYCAGRPCFAVVFTPKPPEELLPTDTLSDEAELVIARLQGVAYIDAEHLYVIRVEGNAASFKKSTFVRIQKIRVVYRQVWSEELNLPILTNSSIVVEFSAFGISGTDRHQYTYANHRFAYPP